MWDEADYKNQKTETEVQKHLSGITPFQNTVWQEIFAGSNFCDFFSDSQKQVLANKNYSKYSSLKNLLQS